MGVSVLSEKLFLIQVAFCIVYGPFQCPLFLQVPNFMEMTITLRNLGAKWPLE